jgi:Protein of unknown function DUF262/Protein of unknown function (DUF1524)
MGMLLEESHPFFVPMYQRAYAWETEVSAFSEDISDLVAGKPDQASHFFGGLVCIEHTDQALSRPHKHEIVDGQQRLATTILALARIMRAAEEIGASAKDAGETAAQQSAETLAADTRDRFIYWKHAIVAEGRTDVRPRLQLSNADDGYFQALLKGQVKISERASHKLLKEAYNELYKTLISPATDSSKTFQQRVVDLDRLRTAIIGQSHVILVVSDDRDRAYQLFSVLNDRGRSLEDADLLRSHTLEMLQGFDSEQTAAAATWDDILASPAKVVSDFLRAYYPSTQGERVGTPMFKKLQEQYFPGGNCSKKSEADAVVAKIDELGEELATFVKLSKGEWPYAPSPEEVTAQKKVFAWNRDRLRRLIVTLRHELAVPLLLAAARSVDEKKFAELVYMLEVFAFRYKNVCGGHATPPSNVYYKEAVSVRASKSNGSSHGWLDLRKKLRDLIDKSASDAQFRTSLENGIRYDSGGSKANIRELLTTLEEHSAWLAAGATGEPVPDKTMVFDLERVSIEHIYPRSPKQGQSDPQLAAVCNNIGNLTFFGPDENSTAGNLSFQDKKGTYYSHSRIQMTNDLAKLATWDIASFSTRTAQILDDACSVFKI